MLKPYRPTIPYLAGCLLAVCVLVGCGEDGGTPPADRQGESPGAGVEEDRAGAQITVCLLPKKKGLPYFTSCADGAAEAARELGNVELIYDGPTDGAPEKSAAMIDRWTLKGVDVICVSPNDPQVLAPAMIRARQEGVKVLTWDADAAADTRLFFVNQATAQGIGYGLVDTLAEDLGGGEAATGQVAILTATLTAANQNAWIAQMKPRLAAKYPGLELVAVEPTAEDQKLAFTKTQDLIKAYPDLKGIFAISSVAFPGAAEAVRQAGKAGEIQVIGLSTPNNMREYVKDGTVKSVLLWNTRDLGYLTVYTARNIVDGVLEPGDTEMPAGRLGTVEVEGDNVLLGDLLIFTKDNIDQYDF